MSLGVSALISEFLDVYHLVAYGMLYVYRRRHRIKTSLRNCYGSLATMRSDLHDFMIKWKEDGRRYRQRLDKTD